MASPEPTADPELKWLREVYQPNVPQLTVRSVLFGMVIGAVMCLSNLYVVLKTGWSIGVTLTACIIAFAFFRLSAGLARLFGLKVNEFSILENNAMGSVASAAGYMTGGGNMAAIPALLMLTGLRPDAWALVAWFALIAGLGVFAAIPIKRQMVNVEQLPFPTGTATAETLRALHAHGSSEGTRQAKALGIAGLVGAVIAWVRDAKASWMPFNLPDTFGWPFRLGGRPAGDWTLAFEGSVLMFGAGALMNFRTGWSLLLGALGTYGVLAPHLVGQGIIPEVKYKVIVQWTLWPAAAILVSSGLVSFAFQWRMVARSIKEFVAVFRRRRADAQDPLAAVECPQWWFPVGFLLLSPFVVILAWQLFSIPPWAGALAIPLAVVMGVVASRVTGETDVTPTKALGPLTQFIYAGLVPRNITANVMAANITGGVGLHAADLLTDLKSGYLLGAKPRQQFFGQLFGVVAGAAVVVPAFNLLVPNRDVLGTPSLPAPAVQVWAGVSKMLAEGIEALHPTARWAALLGLLLGTVLALAERYAPKKAKPFIPSPSGLGIAMVITGFNSVSMFLGTLAAALMRRRLGKDAGDKLTLPIASGFIAGESLMGIAIKGLVVAGLLSR